MPRKKVTKPKPELTDEQLLASAASAATAHARKVGRTPAIASHAKDEAVCPVCFTPISTGDRTVTVLVKRSSSVLHRSCASAANLRRLGV